MGEIERKKRVPNPNRRCYQTNIKWNNINTHSRTSIKVKGSGAIANCARSSVNKTKRRKILLKEMKQRLNWATDTEQAAAAAVVEATGTVAEASEAKKEDSKKQKRKTKQHMEFKKRRWKIEISCLGENWSEYWTNERANTSSERAQISKHYQCEFVPKMICMNCVWNPQRRERLFNIKSVLVLPIFP